MRACVRVCACSEHWANTTVKEDWLLDMDKNSMFDYIVTRRICGNTNRRTWLTH